MGNPHVGAGVDVAYHYWPASAEYRLAYDRYLRTTRYQAMGSETWAFHVMQATAHLRLVGPTRLRTSPWMQVGAGAYRINRNLSPPDWSGSPLIYLGPVRTIEFTHGLNASAGISFWTSPDTQIGLRANYHYLVSMTDGVPALEVATVGAHFLFGLPQRHK